MRNSVNPKGKSQELITYEENSDTFKKITALNINKLTSIFSKEEVTNNKNIKVRKHNKKILEK